MNELSILTLTFVVNTLSMFSASFMLYLIYQQTNKTQLWNRRKTSEEVLSRLVTGTFYDLQNKLYINYNWDPVNTNTSYSEAISKLENHDLKNMQAAMRSILRILESICINIKHNMIEEDICYDYLFSILINIYKKSFCFIENERNVRNNKHVFEYVEFYAIRWEKRYIEEEYANNPDFQHRIKNGKSKL